jgi:ATP-dependent DNA helicase RecQ
MGPTNVDKYGADLIALCRGDNPPRLTTPPSKLKSESPKPQPTILLTSSPAAPPGAPSVTAVSSRVGSHDAALPRIGQAPSAVRENKRPAPAPPPSELTPAQLALEARLKDWRRDEARTAGLPSFFILSDTVLRAIAQTGPQSLGDMASVRGLAADKLDRFGAAILAVVKG